MVTGPAKYKCRWCDDFQDIHTQSQLAEHLQSVHKINLTSRDLSLFAKENQIPIVSDDVRRFEDIVRQHVSASARAMGLYLDEKLRKFLVDLTDSITRGISSLHDDENQC